MCRCVDQPLLQPVMEATLEPAGVFFDREAQRIGDDLHGRMIAEALTVCAVLDEEGGDADVGGGVADHVAGDDDVCDPAVLQLHPYPFSMVVHICPILILFTNLSQLAPVPIHRIFCSA